MSQQRRRLPRLFPAELFLVTAGSRAGLLALLTDLEAYLGRPEDEDYVEEAIHA